MILTGSLMDHRRTVPSSEPDRKRCGSVAEKSMLHTRFECSANAATCAVADLLFVQLPENASQTISTGCWKSMLCMRS